MLVQLHATLVGAEDYVLDSDPHPPGPEDRGFDGERLMPA